MGKDNLQFGVKIKKFSSGVLYESLLGCRQTYGGVADYTKAVLSRSLLLEFLKHNGLRTSLNGSTRDIISIDFNLGSSSYDEAKKKVEKIIGNETDEDRLERLEGVLGFMECNKDKFVKKSKEDIRKEWYENGVQIPYTFKKRDGSAKTEIVHYRFLYRSTGQAKQGSAVFIRDSLFKKARRFMYMGIELPKKDAKLVEIGAYSSLCASTIVDIIKINPRNVLVLDDVDSFFKTNVVSVEVGDDGHLTAVHKSDYELKNTINDGMALLDTSVFPNWATGYVLLRNHMTKCAAFKTNIQTFFKDYFGNEYCTAVVKDKWGNEHLAKDVVMITTTEAMKWLKFDVTYDEFCDIVEKSGNIWGIVKTAHESKHLNGDAQQMSYQMVNCLELDSMYSVTKFTRDYIYKLRSDDEEFLKFLQEKKNFANDYEMLLTLVKHCGSSFLKSDYFKERKRAITQGLVKRFRGGKVLIENADNLVMCGNPYFLLLRSAGETKVYDPTFQTHSDSIACYTPRFSDEEYLAGFRSPHNGINNILALKNTYHPFFERYFDLSKQCIAVNCIGTDVQDRANGADFDSDSIFCTNEHNIVDRALYAYKCYPTIVNNVPMDKSSYGNKPEDYAKADILINSGNRVIGESSNLAQIALSYSYTFTDNREKYDDLVCILSVVAQLGIDSAKKRVSIDLAKETQHLKKQLDIKTNGVPKFWISLGKSGSNVNLDIECPMNRLGGVKIKGATRGKYVEVVKFKDLMVDGVEYRNTSKSKRVEDMVASFSMIYKNCSDRMRNTNSSSSKSFLAYMYEEEFNEFIEKLRGTYISKKSIGLMFDIISRAFGEVEDVKTKNNKPLLLKVLYETSPNTFLSCFKKSE